MDPWTADPVAARDREHLNLLSIFNFVAGGLVGLGGLASAAMTAVVFSRPWPEPFLQRLDEAGRHADHVAFRSNPEFFGRFFTTMMTMLALVAIGAAVLCVLNGLFLRRRRHRTFGFVVAALQCIWVPLGTVLGVFTLVVLARPSVARLYEGAADRPDGVTPPAPPPPPLRSPGR